MAACNLLLGGVGMCYAPVFFFFLAVKCHKLVKPVFQYTPFTAPRHNVN